ncbi:MULTISPECIES: PTS fructose transporter subunit IIA [unclassified Streptomyces]|uniref:PTS-dependent dihydroxyacetone kinase phosphotransferase subunit DhaM n=1 Tax=unclassified Streptomyces TaxID=2593676 RepID=UPI002DDA19BF|nr:MULTISPECIES: PTS fructose transporter subunit IIA [unclassified Streptomyces]WSA90253.1 PTS fructose transporter subunit IIA [Streptomyces sp. NBC_01795]WSB74479.1 PTS fructose transporter subunit IIA [Streptomyces sp. NBC_01775]WSS17136.1 PTS fructose transporter subunit IIA [Streptomyces sp. NBC_01186]WSS45883.1 PTS fructose transporter subunit IIA [Streptomyces sp. NBC_01187]
MAAAEGNRVGIVLVSHSKEVADSVAQLAAGLAGVADAPVTGAGGGPDGGLGTSAELVTEAAHRVDSGAGVAILVDLGSAVLTVKSLLAEGDELPEPARLVDAPLIEGAVAAVVTAAGGADLDAVAAAAGEAYDYRKM